jgi:cardiolipin synthase A/B
MARRLSWPLVRRPGGASMHAKVIVVDEEAALVSSANATGHAMTRNLECGVLIRGGSVPQRIRRHVFSLVERGELVAC